MGFLRFFLALAIIIGHGHYQHYIPDGIFPFLHSAEYGGYARVDSFFLISGFFSEMLVNGRLTDNKHYIFDFYTGRIIRLLPCYYFIGVLTLWFCIIGPHYGFQIIKPKEFSRDFVEQNFHSFGGWYVFANLLPLDPEVLRIDFSHLNQRLFLMVTQSWTMTIEWLCLLIAPLVLKHRIVFILCTIVAANTAVFLWSNGIYNCYAGNTVIFYLLGSLAYRLYLKFLVKREITTRMKSIILVIFVILMVVLFNFYYLEIMFGSEFVYFGFLFLVFASLPFLFAGSRTFLKDKIIGDLAYPMYLNHFLVLEILLRYKCKPITIFWLGLFLSVFCAVLMLWLIDMPLMRLRHRIVYKQKK